MSIYRELKKGPSRAVSSRRMRCDTIYKRLDAQKEARKKARDKVKLYGKKKGKKSKPCKRDREFEKHKLSKDEKKKIDEMEKELEDDDEKLVLEEKVIEELKKEVLMVEDQDLHLQENGVDHNTDEYDCVEDEEDPQIVVRRGQEFKLTLTFQRPWNGKIDDMNLIFKLGERPNRNKGTYAKIKLEEGNDTSYKDGAKKNWGARILSQEGKSLTLAVYSPPNAIIGAWEYAVQTVKTDERKRKIYQCVGKDDIIILLNPYCKDDQVYMPEQEHLKEYVENEYGISFFGSWLNIKAKPWHYAQFQEKILDISLHLLRKAFDYEITKKMSNPVHIARALSRILNDCDDMGVLAGNWSGDYAGGVKPTHWKGSQAILTQYFETREPVNYGQCWVFSHVLTTVARALGLPCRSVTNFASAHDTNLSMTIDKYVDDKGDVIKSKSHDSVWNFHVWNEVWMCRPDLDKLHKAEGKYDGWHAIDATPQETSDYLFQCGPTPLVAIQNGEMHIGFDTKFIFAEVNANSCVWRDDGDEPVLVSQDHHRVGKNMSTKTPTGKQMEESWFDFGYGYEESDRLDVTHLYKHPDGSVAEREAMENAFSDGEMADVIFNNPTGIAIEILPLPKIKVGDSFTVSVKVENTSEKQRVVTTHVNVRPMTYWGDVIGTHKVATDIFRKVEIQAGKSENFDLTVECERYLNECDSFLNMSVLAMAVVESFDDWENSVHKSEDLQVQGPKLKVTGPKHAVKAGDLITVELEFTNPLDRTIKNCFLTIEGSAKVMEEFFEHKHSAYKKKIDDIKAKETRCIKVKIQPNMRPKKSKEREVEFGIDCDDFPEIEGSLFIKLH